MNKDHINNILLDDKVSIDFLKVFTSQDHDDIVYHVSFTVYSSYDHDVTFSLDIWTRNFKEFSEIVNKVLDKA